MGQTQSAGPPGPSGHTGPTGAPGPGFTVADASMKCVDGHPWPVQMCLKELPDGANDDDADPPVDGAVCVPVPKFREDHVCAADMLPDVWFCSPNPLLALNAANKLVGVLEETCRELRHDACTIVDVRTDRPYASFGYDPRTLEMPEGAYRLQTERGEECCMHAVGSEPICARGLSTGVTFRVPERGQKYTTSTDLTARWLQGGAQ